MAAAGRRPRGLRNGGRVGGAAMGIARGRVTSMADNGGPPPAAATLYPGTVMHQRLKPFRHRFTYRVFSILLDVGRLDAADRLSPFFSVNRANIASFQESDHA